MSVELIYSLIFILVILQSIVGVGVLVLGTPIFLTLDYNIIEVMNLLLPISIFTSLLNYLYLKSNKKIFKISLDKEIKRSFAYIFFPGIILGLYLTNKFFLYLNFKILVSIIIFISIFVKWKYDKIINDLPLHFKKYILILISVIHGLTNSGGTLLTIFFTSFHKNKKNQSRYSITFYYLILASIQYFAFLYIFRDQIKFILSYEIFLLILISAFTGNLIVKYVNQNLFKNLIQLLAFGSAIILLLNN